MSDKPKITIEEAQAAFDSLCRWSDQFGIAVAIVFEVPSIEADGRNIVTKGLRMNVMPEEGHFMMARAQHQLMTQHVRDPDHAYGSVSQVMYGADGRSVTMPIEEWKEDNAKKTNNDEETRG